MSFQPAVKWSGAKRYCANEILDFFPKKIKTYYEPFCGGASVLRRLLSRGDIECSSFVCSDINRGLIDLWNAIKRFPEALCERYDTLWEGLNASEDIGVRKRFYNIVRDRYNGDGEDGHDAGDFLFLLRTCANGMPRYNGDGKFNTSLHLTRGGIRPAELCRILSEWSRVLNEHGVVFECRSYDETEPEKDDFVFLDPPYAGTKGMYCGGIDLDHFWEWLGGLKCGYALTFDGKSGDGDRTFPVPRELYDEHVYLKPSNSSFHRVVGLSSDTVVRESLYIRAGK